MDKTIYVTEYRQLLDWLREQRSLNGLTLRDLAGKMKIHHSLIGRIEQAQRRMDIIEYIRLCEGIGCDPCVGLKLIMPDLCSSQGNKPGRTAKSAHSKVKSRRK